MSFCSQALIGFCNAETGVSQDVGVALSMGQGEPVSIQPWTLPPTHPLSLNHPLIGQSRIRASSDPRVPDRDGPRPRGRSGQRVVES